MVYAKQGVHFSCGGRKFGIHEVRENVVYGFYVSVLPFAKLPHRRAQSENPYRRANRDFVVLFEIDARVFYRHAPAVHSESAAPPKPEIPVAIW